MRKIIITAVVFLAMMSIYGCTDSQRASFSALGDECILTMYSGGEVVGKWESTGKITTMSQSDGWEFKDKKTGKLVRVSGDVVIMVK